MTEVNLILKSLQFPKLSCSSSIPVLLTKSTWTFAPRGKKYFPKQNPLQYRHIFRKINENPHIY